MNKSVFITGASGGIGSAAALRLAKDGYRVACCYNSDNEGAQALANKLEKAGADYRLYKLDRGNTAETEKVFKEASEFFGGFSVVVNCAGTALRKLFEETTEDEVKNTKKTKSSKKTSKKTKKKTSKKTSKKKSKKK